MQVVSILIFSETREMTFFHPESFRKRFYFLIFSSITGDNDAKDFAYSYFNQWTPNDAAGTEDVTHSIVGAMCQIYGNWRWRLSLSTNVKFSAFVNSKLL